MLILAILVVSSATIYNYNEFVFNVILNMVQWVYEFWNYF